jgi:hypothetical protein
MPTPTKKAPTKKAATNAGGDSASTPGGGRGVEYPVEAVTEMVEAAETSHGNKARYRKLMVPLTEQVGQLFKLAVFTSAGGARRVAGQMKNGKTEVPGDPNDWEFTAIVPKDGEGSILYVRYLGEGNGPEKAAEEDTEEEEGE